MRAVHAEGLSDSFGRVMRDLRVSVTDRCNFRCLYCLPETEEAANFYRGKFDPVHNPKPLPGKFPQWKTRSEILTFEEIERLVRIFAANGIEKIRLTGGEPLLRNALEHLIQRIALISGIKDIAITTNGFLFSRKAEALKKAGLHRVSFSMDSLDRENFHKMTGRDGLEQVQESINLAKELGFSPVKVNAVIIRGINDHEIERLAAFAFERELSLRYIEFMPLDSSRAWLKEMVVSGREILDRLGKVFPLELIPSSNPSETARRWGLPPQKGEIGIIAPVTEPFCGHCNRIRLTADGKIRTCLFSLHDHEIKQGLRNGSTDLEIEQLLHQIVWQKEARHNIGQAQFVQPGRSMSCIGG
jgi:GTP 3',8-cyclase